MSEIPQWVQLATIPSASGDTIGAAIPPRLKPTLDLTIPPQLGGDKVETAVYTPPASLNLAQNPSDSKSHGTSSQSNHNSSSNVGPLSPVNGAAPPQFPTQPCLLANKYLITRSIDSNTSEALHLPTHTVLIVKCLPSQNAREVCARHALLGDQEGIRPPLELIQGNKGRSWLVVAPHYGDLHSYVRTRRRIREGEAQRLFGQVARVVNLCHGAGLVLRDLKLRKIVFTDANRRNVSLESLEDSVVSGGEDTLEDKHGCPAYVAPEILRAAAYSGRAADMWSLGVMLYTMLIGRYPFHGCDTNALFLKIRSGDFIVPDWVSSRARHLIQLLLQRDPTSRPTASTVLAHPWLTRPPRDLPPRDITDHRVPEMMPREQSSLARNRQSIFFFH